MVPKMAVFELTLSPPAETQSCGSEFIHEEVGNINIISA